MEEEFKPIPAIDVYSALYKDADRVSSEVNDDIHQDIETGGLLAGFATLVKGLKSALGVAFYVVVAFVVLLLVWVIRTLFVTTKDPESIATIVSAATKAQSFGV